MWFKVKNFKILGVSHSFLTVSYTHLDVYKRQAVIFAYLRLEQTILCLIIEYDDDDDDDESSN